MIASSHNQNEFVGLVLNLSDFEFRVFLFQVVRIDKSSFMPQMFTAFTKMFRKIISCFFFQNGSLVNWYAIPKFGLALMKIVDS